MKKIISLFLIISALASADYDEKIEKKFITESILLGNYIIDTYTEDWSYDGSSEELPVARIAQHGVIYYQDVLIDNIPYLKYWVCDDDNFVLYEHCIRIREEK